MARELQITNATVGKDGPGLSPKDPPACSMNRAGVCHGGSLKSRSERLSRRPLSPPRGAALSTIDGSGERDQSADGEPDLASVRAAAASQRAVKLSNDPQLVEKVRDIVGPISIRLIEPWCCALTRTARSKPSTAPGRCCRCVLGRHSGAPAVTVDMAPSLFAILDVARGKVIGETHRRYRSLVPPVPRSHRRRTATRPLTSTSCSTTTAPQGLGDTAMAAAGIQLERAAVAGRPVRAGRLLA